ncbi:hypothetical protein [Paraherbaspirillum soli]|uniref:Uncharacterized protein n=1 Tax=Paraherbaspirillum soli TaxID=631222 RepID=A0ABW0MH92_9BURK
MTWEPITELEIWDNIVQAEVRMNPEQLRLWETIKLAPQKWAQCPYGDEGGGFWVVAVLGQIVVWYNDIEDGFNTSRYSAFGIIDEYWCNQDELEITVQSLLNQIQHGYAPPKCRAPTAVEHGNRT